MSFLEGLAYKLFWSKKLHMLEINGMHCAHCKRRVEDAARKTKGILWAEVDLEKGLLRYAVDTAFQPDDLFSAIEMAGFQARR